MNSPMASADIPAPINTKNASSRYLSGRSVRSSHRGKDQLRLNVPRPSFQSHSEKVPTGQSQLQKLRRNTSEMIRKVASSTMAAGWMRGISPVTKKYFKLSKPAIGSQPSTPGGRERLETTPTPRS